MATHWCANGHEFDRALSHCPLCGAGTPRGWDSTSQPMANSPGMTEPYLPVGERRGSSPVLLPLLAGMATFCCVLAVVLGIGSWLLVGHGGALAALPTEALSVAPFLGMGKEAVAATATAPGLAPSERSLASPSPVSTAVATPAPVESPGGPTLGPPPGGTPAAAALPARVVTIATPLGVPLRCAVVGNSLDSAFDLPGREPTTLILPPGVYTFTCSTRAGVVGFGIPVFTIVVPESGGIALPAVARPFLIISVAD